MIRTILKQGRLYGVILLPAYALLFALLYYGVLIAVTPVTIDSVFSYQLKTWEWVVKAIIILPPAWIMARTHGFRLAGLHRLRHLPDKVRGIKDVEVLPTLIVVVGYNMAIWAVLFIIVAWAGSSPEIPDAGYDMGLFAFTLLNFAIGSLDRSPDEGRSLNHAIDEAMEEEEFSFEKAASDPLYFINNPQYDTPIFNEFSGNSWHTCLK